MMQAGKALIIFLVSITISTLIIAKPIWKLCDGNRSNDILQISSVVTNPEIPRAGAPFTITMSGLLSQDITNGYVDFDVSYGSVPLLDVRLRLCTVFLPCPVPKGPTIQTVTQYFSILSPPGGPYTGTINIQTNAGQNITCVNYDFMLGWPQEQKRDLSGNLKRSIVEWKVRH